MREIWGAIRGMLIKRECFVISGSKQIKFLVSIWKVALFLEGLINMRE